MPSPTDRPPTPSEQPAASQAAVAASLAKVERPTPELADAIRRGYEPKDITLRGLFIFLGSLVATLCLVLVVIYGVMMALVENDRSHDVKGSTVSVVRGPTYAPLQPSPEHNSEDWVDMIVMRQYAQEHLNGSGEFGEGPLKRRYIPIDQAMDQVVDLLPKARSPVDLSYKPKWTYPEGSHEGVYNGAVEVK